MDRRTLLALLMMPNQVTATDLVALGLWPSKNAISRYICDYGGEENGFYKGLYGEWEIGINDLVRLLDQSSWKRKVSRFFHDEEELSYMVNDFAYSFFKALAKVDD